MNPQNLHAHEDRLLDFAYGELPVSEARVVEAHLQGCARCTQALHDIRGVRVTMSQLSPMEPAPDAGLESLLAYAH
ncbi:anti-sigma factor family protein, partial [Pyxidicoccus sp. 3LG]